MTPGRKHLPTINAAERERLAEAWIARRLAFDALYLNAPSAAAQARRGAEVTRNVMRYLDRNYERTAA